MTGTVLGKRYEILEKIDSGGMAYIYKALCRKTNDIVAIKILKENFTGNAEYVDRFKKEAEAVFSLEHENIVRVTDIGFDEGSYYMVMEYIEGSTLKTVIGQRTYIPEKEAVQYALQICSALSAAHRKGIIHRDIKPHNILIDNSGNVKLTDFGIAKSVSTNEDNDNQVIGSVYYISPEQAKGERVDPRSDIYSLGIVLYEMLTGVLPHTGGKTVSVALKHINEQITPPSDINREISKALNFIILKATSKNKRDRYQSVDELKKDLAHSLSDTEGSFVNVPAAYKSYSARPAVTKKKNLIWKAGMLFVLLAVIASLVTAGFIIFNPPAQQAFLVPDFVGSTMDSAQQQLGNLSVNTTFEPSESADAGTIISQSPAAGTNAGSGDPITLTISSGPDEPVMPDLYGMSLEEAKAQLKLMELNIGEDNIAYDYQQDAPPGVVISQTPEAGAPVTEADTLAITVSEADVQDNVLMPELSGKIIDQAVSLLRENGFNNCFVYEDESDLVEGTVISQTPEKGIPSPLTDKIILTISELKNKIYHAVFTQNIDITETESKVEIVLQEIINGETINIIVKEYDEDAGSLPVSLNLSSNTQGSKKVIVYVNNLEVFSGEVEFH